MKLRDRVCPGCRQQCSATDGIIDYHDDCPPLRRLCRWSKRSFSEAEQAVEYAAQGADSERSAIVAWLRDGAKLGVSLLPDLADAIERGEHVR